MTETTVESKLDLIKVRPIATTKRRYLGQGGISYGVLSNRDVVEIHAVDFHPSIWEKVEEPAQETAPAEATAESNQAAGESAPEAESDATETSRNTRRSRG